MPRPPSLEEQILAVLERALEEGQGQAAEQLLRALEALCGDTPPGSVLADAHLMAAGDRVPGRSRH